jgi:mannosyl-oligosaccharide alpha-1,2-mannosidase
MVDALDTLWIMGLTEEFEDAVKAVGGIDFTTSSRRDIPVFETVIRYLGGLISAYDVSEGRYDILLRKAVELANVLMGAFDTPNRMPQTYYNWRPTFASNPHRASYNVVLAELGSLSMEFTRLAQLTKEPKYYDAVARITNELSIWQNNTKIPGLWPKLVDASGCKKPEIGGSSRDIKSTENITPVDARPEIKSAEDVSPFVATPLDKRETLDKVQMLDNRQMLDYRQIDPEGLNTTISPPKSQPQVLSQPQVSPQPQNPIVECEEQGLASRPGASTEAFTLGGMADSTYEYLPKQFLLLGGLVPKYKSMYEKAADAATNYLLYRPMIPDSENSILAMASGLAQNDPSKLQLSYEQGHLTCFLGGMYGIGAKIFKREQDLEIAKKLTDGCVWAYSATKSGLMPENFLHIPCDNMENCPWNQTTWEHLLDPHPEQRQSSYDWAVKHEQDLLRLEKEKLEKALSEKAALEKERFDTERLEAEIEKDNTAEKLLSTPTHHTLKKRQLGHVDNILPSNLPQTSASTSVAGKPITPVDQLNPSTKIPPLLSHKDYVEDRVKGERMSLGIPQILSPKYILRYVSLISLWRSTLKPPPLAALDFNAHDDALLWGQDPKPPRLATLDDENFVVFSFCECQLFCA